MPSQRPSRSSFVDNLIAIGSRELAACCPAVDQAEAKLAMQRVAQKVQTKLAGSTLYVAAGHAVRVAKRNAELRRSFSLPGPDGTSARSAARITQLAATYSLSVRHVRSIVGAKYQAGQNTQTSEGNHA